MLTNLLRRDPQKGIIGGVLLIFFVILALNLTIGAISAQYVIDFWATRSSGHAVHIPFFPHALLIGLFGGELTIPAAIITLIIAPFLS